MFFLNFLTKYKNTQKLALLFAISLAITSCGDVGCNEAGEYYVKTYKLYANPKNFSKDGVIINSYGGYGDKANAIDWYDTGLLYSAGNKITVTISGHWASNAPSFKTYDEIGKNLKHCKICTKEPSSTDSAKPNIDNNQCYCTPTLNEEGIITPQNPEYEEKKVDGTPNSTNLRANTDCNNNLSHQRDGNICSCQKPVNISNAELTKKLTFSLGSSKKLLKSSSDSPKQQPTPSNEQNPCRLSMGIGAYLALYTPESSSTPDSLPEIVYHMFSLKEFCPIKRQSNGECKDANGNIRTKFIWESPNPIPFNEAGTKFSEDLSKIKLALYDHFYKDNSGYYELEFVGGIIQKEGDGIFSSSIKLAEDFLFGSNDYNQELRRREKKDGVAEFMFRAVLDDPVVKNVISISLVLYVTFYGLAFLSGVVDFGRKELMTRLLKFGLVVLFTNPKAWQFYNGFVVQFFKGGMDTMVKVVTSIFELKISPTLGSIILQADETSTSVHKKFIYVDMIVRDLISKPNINRIFGLLFTKGTEFLSIAYIPIILALILYFIYTVLDITIKYLINLIKICFGLALGPVFILFSLFEKTKDMFKNWLSFMGSRTFEIILLFSIFHPFLMLIDQNFKSMMDFKVCIQKLENDYYPFNIPQSELGNRTVFTWAEFFFKIGAMIFIMKTFANKAGYISGQIISIGGVSNADSVTEKGYGESGFSLAGGIARGVAGIAKSAVKSKYTGGVAKYVIRLGISAGTKIGRAKFGTDRSLNERINDGFRAVGIRFRGARSLMRDAKIDSAISKAAAAADSEKLTGTERENFIRKKTTEAMNVYNFQNKNNSAILGINSENISKRLDEKLIKQPMKKMVKEKALQYKEQGIYGKEAQDLIKKDIENWSNDNLSSTSQKKVSEFFKKSSVRHLMKSESTISGGQAAKITETLLSSGSIEQAKEFADKYRDNMTRMDMEQKVKKQETLDSGGKSAKFIRTALNTAFFVPGNVMRMLYKGGELTIDSVKKPKRIIKNAKKFIEVAKKPMHLKDHHWDESNVGQKINKILGKVENKGTDLRRWAKSFQIPFLNEGAAKSNPKKALRKFDRKMARILSREEDFKNGNKIEDARKKFGLDDSQKIKNIKDLGVVGEFGKVRADDTLLTSVGKILITPITKPVNTIAKIVNDRFSENKDNLKEFHRRQKTNALQRLANEIINDKDNKKNPFAKIFDEDLEKSILRDKTEKDALQRFERTAKKEEARNAQKLLEKTLEALDKKSRKIVENDRDDKTLFEEMNKESRLKFQEDMKKQMKAKEDNYKKEKDELEEQIKSEVNIAQQALDDKSKLGKDDIDKINKDLEKIENYQKLEDNKKQLMELNEKLKSATDEEKKSIEAEKIAVEKKIKDGEEYKDNLLKSHKAKTDLELDTVVQNDISTLNKSKVKIKKEIKDLEEKFNNIIQDGELKKEKLKNKLFSDLDYLSGAILKTKKEILDDISSDGQLAKNIYSDFEKYIINTASSGGSASDSLLTSIPSSDQENENSIAKNLSEEILANFVEATRIKRENSAKYEPEDPKPDNDSTGSSGGEGKQSNLDTSTSKPFPPIFKEKPATPIFKSPKDDQTSDSSPNPKLTTSEPKILKESEIDGSKSKTAPSSSNPTEMKESEIDGSKSKTAPSSSNPTEMFDEFAKHTKDFIEDTAEKASKFVEGATKPVTDVLKTETDKVAESIKKQTEDLLSQANKIKEEAEKNIDNLGKEATKAFEEISSWFNPKDKK